MQVERKVTTVSLRMIFVRLLEIRDRGALLRPWVVLDYAASHQLLIPPVIFFTVPPIITIKHPEEHHIWQSARTLL